MTSGLMQTILETIISAYADFLGTVGPDLSADLSANDVHDLCDISTIPSGGLNTALAFSLLDSFIQISVVFDWIDPKPCLSDQTGQHCTFVASHNFSVEALSS